MKKSKYTDEHIAFAVKQTETGTRAEEVCREMGVSQATLYNWKKKYGGLDHAPLLSSTPIWSPLFRLRVIRNPDRLEKSGNPADLSSRWRRKGFLFRLVHFDRWNGVEPPWRSVRVQTIEAFVFHRESLDPAGRIAMRTDGRARETIRSERGATAIIRRPRLGARAGHRRRARR